MTALGFSMIFDTEQHAFVDILEGTKDFNEGRLRPEKREISEKEHQEFSLLANQSVSEFNSFLKERCGQYTDPAKRERCVVNASKEWLNAKGKKYEGIPSRYISGNDLAMTFIEDDKQNP